VTGRSGAIVATIGSRDHFCGDGICAGALGVGDIGYCSGGELYAVVEPLDVVAAAGICDGGGDGDHSAYGGVCDAGERDSRGSEDSGVWYFTDPFIVSFCHVNITAGIK